jgi:hypothetical protein
VYIIPQNIEKVKLKAPGNMGFEPNLVINCAAVTLIPESINIIPQGKEKIKPPDCSGGNGPKIALLDDSH